MKKTIRIFASLFAVSFCFSLWACGKEAEKNKNENEIKFSLGGDYLAVNEFSEGLALIKDANGFAYITTEGEISFRPQVSEAGNFSEGKAWYKRADGKGGYMDETGATVGDEINGFGTAVQDDYKHGLAAVTSMHAYGVDAFVLDSHGKRSSLFSYFTNTGEYGGFYEGISWYLPQGGNLFGYVQADGKKLIEPKYKTAGNFSNGRARVEDDNGTHYIDETGEVVFSLQTGEDGGEFSDGALKITSQTGIYYVNTEGEKLFDGNFISGGNFSEGKATVKTNEGLQVIDEMGKVLFSAPQGTTALGEYRGGVATYSVGNKWGYLDKEGNVLVKAVLEYAFDCSEGYAACRYEGKWGYLKLGVEEEKTEGSEKEETEQVKYKIYFDFQLASATMPTNATSVKYDEAKELYFVEVALGEEYIPFTPACDGYEFLEWQYVSDSSKKFLGGKYQTEGDTYLLAIWSGGEIVDTPIQGGN